MGDFMSYGKVRGSCWCNSCQKDQTSFLTKIVHYEDRKEILGVCSVCSLPVSRILSTTDNDEVVEASEVREETVVQKKQDPITASKSNRSRKKLPILLTLAGLLLIVLSFN